VRACRLDTFFHRIKDGFTFNPFSAFTGRHAAYYICTVGDHLLGMEKSLAPRDTLYQQPCIFVNQDSHRQLFTPLDASITAFWAASTRVTALWIFGKLASSIIWRPSAAFVPTNRITIGTLVLMSFSACRIPRATSSPRVIPPKILSITALTLGSD